MTAPVRDADGAGPTAGAEHDPVPAADPTDGADLAAGPAPVGGASSAGPPRGEPGAVRQRIPHLPTALVASGALLVVCVVAGAVHSGAVGAAGAAAGVCLVALSYVGSTLAIAWADSVRPQLVLTVGLVAYTVKFTYIGLGMAALAAANWAGLPAMGASLIAAVVVWNAAQIWYVVRHPVRADLTEPEEDRR